jgi:hypothetical protein
MAESLLSQGRTEPYLESCLWGSKYCEESLGSPLYSQNQLAPEAIPVNRHVTMTPEKFTAQGLQVRNIIIKVRKGKTCLRSQTAL